MLKLFLRCLLHSAGYLHYTHGRAADIIYTCITLHNFLLHYNCQLETDIEIFNEEFEHDDTHHRLGQSGDVHDGRN